MGNKFEDEAPPAQDRKPAKVIPLPQAPKESRTPAPLDWQSLSAQEPPARQWAIKGWLGYGHVTLLIGSGGIGKTLIAQQIGSCLSIGREAFIDEIGGRAKVLMWACEDDHDELWRRQVSISKWLQTGIESFDDFMLFARHGYDNAMVTTEFGKLMFTPNIELLRQQAMDLQAKVVILDNVAQLYGGNENDRYSVTAFMNALSGALPGLAILLLGHPSRGVNSEFSGSSAWENVARTRLYLGLTMPDQKPGEEEPETNVRYLSRRKGNYSERDWRKCIYADGVLIPEKHESTGGIVSAIRSANCEKRVLAAVRALAERGLYATDSRSTDRYLPLMAKSYSLIEDYTKHEIAAAMRSLIFSGQLQRKQVGKNDKRRAIEGLVAASD